MLSIVIPCYNEGNNLKIIFEKIGQKYKSMNELEVILVDNGSTDSTKKVITKSVSKFNHFIKFLRIEKNIGYELGIMEGVRITSGEVIAWTHVDQSY